MQQIPRVVTLPFGYKIRIKQVTKRELHATIGDDAVAGWVACDRIIYLTRSRPIRQKRADLAHELGHAIVDFNDHLLSFGISKI